MTEVRGTVRHLLHFDDPRGRWSQATLEQRARTCSDIASSHDGRSALLTELCEALVSETRRLGALRLLRQLAKTTSALGASAPLRIQRFPVKTHTIDESVELLLVPSIFEPEDWSYTFLEGLLRRPEDSYTGQALVELGTGSGWISIALLKTTSLRRVVALDINPIAVKVARINAILNSYDDEYLPRYDADRKLLFEKLSVEQSDLLGAVLSRGERYDYIVGCIPQVLSPSPDFNPDDALKNLDEARLYDLSNYFVLQGVYEDQFGLGLTARALEQSVYALKRGGSVILNIAGRPGRGVIEKMFTRRGYRMSEIWARRVQQAADTDTAVLAELENKTGNTFEFYVGPHSRLPICAATSEALRTAGREIWHEVRVLEARLRFERELAPFYEATRALKYESFVDQVDLSNISQEQVGFLRRLAEDFARAKVARYTHEQGSAALRLSLATYLKRHFELNTQKSRLFVAPNRQELIYGLILATCEMGDAVLVSGRLSAVYRAALEKAGQRVLVGNDDIAELNRLAEALAPRVVLLAPATDLHRNLAALEQLCIEAHARDQLVVIDGSGDFEITSKLHENALLELIAGMNEKHRPLVVIGLIKNQVYPSLQPAFVIGTDESLQRALSVFAESTYSRLNSFTERYYEQLFDDVLAFQLQRGRVRHPSLAPPTPERSVPLSSRLRQVEALPAFIEPPPGAANHSLGPGESVLRLDYGENELELPDRLVQGILLGFTNLDRDISHDRLAALIAGFYSCREAKPYSEQQVAVGSGVFPLLYDVAHALRTRLGRPPRIAIAAGHYGFLPPVFSLAGSEILELPSEAEHGFALTRTALQSLERAPDALLIVNPNNPSGTFYDPQILGELLEYAAEHDSWVLSDEIFAELDLGGPGDPEASSLIRLSQSRAIEQKLVRFGGFSKMFAAGGLRIGWALCKDVTLIRQLERLRLSKVERHSRVAGEVMLRMFSGTFAEQSAALEELSSYLTEIRQRLSEQRSWLVQALTASGATLPKGRPGGLFVFPNVQSWYGKPVALPNGERVTLTEDALPSVLSQGFGLQVNPGVWAGVPGHIRMCFSLDARRTLLLRERLTEFLAALR